jgi:hypothetical protein
MHGDGAIIFRDLVGRAQHRVRQVRGRYHLHRLIEHYGIDAKLFDWSE